MRWARVFNGVHFVEIEWLWIGLRFRARAMTGVAFASLIAAGLSVLFTPWVGVPIGVFLVLLIVLVNIQLNRMDPEAYVREGTQISMFMKTWRKPTVMNTGRW